MTFRHKLFNVIDEKNKETTLSRTFDFFIIGLIALNVAAIILESFEGLRVTYKQEFFYFEIFSVIIFSVEYLLRLITADLKYPNKTRFGAGISFVLSPLALIDLFAILPTYLPLIIPIDLRFIRIWLFRSDHASLFGLMVPL